MLDVHIRAQVVEELYAIRIGSNSGAASVSEVSALAKRIEADPRRVAMVCASLIKHRHVVGDGNLMGFVALSDTGFAYYRAVKELNQ